MLQTYKMYFSRSRDPRSQPVDRRPLGILRDPVLPGPGISHGNQLLDDERWHHVAIRVRSMYSLHTRIFQRCVRNCVCGKCYLNSHVHVCMYVSILSVPSTTSPRTVRPSTSERCIWPSTTGPRRTRLTTRVSRLIRWGRRTEGYRLTVSRVI